LLPNERTWFGKEKETVEMAQESSLEPKKMHCLKMASSLFRFRISLQRALWWFLSLHFCLRTRDESRKLCWGDDTLLGGQKEQQNTYRTLMVVKKERGLNRKRTQATTGRDAQLNFTKLLEVTVPKRCLNQILLFISP